MHFGQITVDAVSDGYLLLPLSAFPDAPAEAFATHGGVSGTMFIGELTTFVIRTAGQTVLVDTGLGPRLLRTLEGETGKLPTALAAAGVQPERVDAVVFTHLHFDHIGWNYVQRDDESVPMFPNARYVIHRPEWDRWAADETGPIRRNVRPLADSGQLVLVDDGHEPAPGISLLWTPGHTTGHVSVLIYSGGAGGVITGDAAHHPAELEQPQWSPSFDDDRDLSARTRAALVERAEAEGLIVMGGHFPPPLAGRVVRVEGRRSYQPIT